VLHPDEAQDPELWRYFTVATRCDRDPCFLTQMEIVQNHSGVWAGNDVYVPSWPQPGLLPRDPSRGERIEHVGFLGNPENLDASMKNPEFQRALAELGMRLVVRETPDDWRDYRDIDVIIAVRRAQRFLRALKPAAKVTNAWIAGCPAIVSAEQGFKEVRRSELDYFQAETAAEVLACLHRLRDAPGLYAEMVNNGRKRADAFRQRAVADAWIAALDGPIAREFTKWQRMTPAMRRLRYLVGRVRNAIWGPHAVPNPGGGWKKLLRPIRRTISHPGHLRVWRVQT
jgi:hypothetical protein